MGSTSITNFYDSGRIMKIQRTNLDGAKKEEADFWGSQNMFIDLTYNGVKNSKLELQMPEYNFAKPTWGMGSRTALRGFQDSEVNYIGSDQADTLTLGKYPKGSAPETPVLDFKNSKVSLNLGQSTYSPQTGLSYVPDEVADEVYVNPGFQGVLDISHGNDKDTLELPKEWTMQVVEPKRDVATAGDLEHQFTNPHGGIVNVKSKDNKGLKIKLGAGEFQIGHPARP